MASTQDFRNGYTFIWNDGIWQIVEFMHVKPGKGSAFVRTRLRNVRNGKVVERRSFQFLYEDELGLHLMNTETYEQTTLPADRIASRGFVKEGSEVDILYHAETDEPLTVEVPRQVELVVAETEPGVKGDTATGAVKQATLESGATINVPLFINEGDVVRVDTESGTYITRVSSN
jgi:elongation factor P